MYDITQKCPIFDSIYCANHEARPTIREEPSLYCMTMRLVRTLLTSFFTCIFLFSDATNGRRAKSADESRLDDFSKDIDNYESRQFPTWSPPQMPGGFPTVPGGGGMPDMPNGGGMPTIGGMPDMPNGGGMPTIGGMPDMPNGGGMPTIGGMPDMPVVVERYDGEYQTCQWWRNAQ
ncbi:hypothetical protein AVEN_116210-1 [Araneus ventricosus]|uniref:Uncharacterized protein n=1 Tax=Araneus ventricosus TaxID=182803 RepID=A0A4Y2ST18_ARAVE|nr:hypothetical protein AVEN_116210-1 [Araneus ventricosus]